MQHVIDQFAATIRAAAGHKTPLCLRGGGSKDFYGNRVAGQITSPPTPLQQVERGANSTLSRKRERDGERDDDMLDTAAYAGIVDYEPTELVVTARAGTRLADLEAELRKQGQMLAFEPPHFGAAATLGGCVASGLSGPRRASVGAVRDFVLGVRMLDGRGNDLRFGGQVMKNVAGYDVSRLLTGSMGTLGLLLEVSLKVLPLPPQELTLRMSMNAAEAITKMNSWAGKALPVSATCFCDGELWLRLSGAEPAVRAAHAKLGGGKLTEDEGIAFWESVREQRHAFFQSGKPLWRLSVKSSAPPLSLPGAQLIEWGGALRWLSGADADAVTMREAAQAAGGHATLFRSGGDEPATDVFHPLAPEMLAIHQRLKEKFDPTGIFNPGRMYWEL